MNNKGPECLPQISTNTGGKSEAAFSMPGRVRSPKSANISNKEASTCLEIGRQTRLRKEHADSEI